MMKEGTSMRCLFLDPDGLNIQARELEESHTPGALTSLTRLNIHMLQRVRSKWNSTMGGNIAIRLYDAPARFNICIVDSEVCVMQPYLPFARGLESPTFVARQSGSRGIFQTFSEVFEEMWREGKEPAVEQNQGISA